jgi:hypothetical protein
MNLLTNSIIYIYLPQIIVEVEYMKEKALLIIGLLVLVMGILGAVPGIGIGSEPIWHAILKIIVGIVAVVIARK